MKITGLDCPYPGNSICHAIRLIGINRVAKRAGISGTYVSLAINGKTTMPVQTVSKLIAAVKGVKP